MCSSVRLAETDEAYKNQSRLGSYPEAQLRYQEVIDRGGKSSYAAEAKRALEGIKG